MVVMGATPQDAMIVPPDFGSTSDENQHFETRTLEGADLDLFASGRLVGTARISRLADTAHPTPDCKALPRAQLVPSTTGTPLPLWSIGFVHARVSAIAIDSIESMSRADSARLVIEIARLASALPDDSAEAFRGLPFVVRTLRRFQPVPGVEALVADVVRKVNQEANPRQEQLFLIAERDSANPGVPPRIAYVDRASGLEEALDAIEVLGAVSLGRDRRATIIISRESQDGTSYALLERSGAVRWRVRWTSAPAGC
jgi:hypothetical protein